MDKENRIVIALCAMALILTVKLYQINTALDDICSNSNCYLSELVDEIRLLEDKIDKRNLTA